MKRMAALVLFAALCSALYSSALTAEAGSMTFSDADFIASTSGFSFSSGAFTYGNIGKKTFPSFVSDPYSPSIGLDSTASPGVSGKVRAFSAAWDPFSILAVAGKITQISLSVSTRYFSSAALWKRVDPEKPGIIADWDEIALEDVLAVAFSGSYPPWISITDAVSYSPLAGVRNLLRAETVLGPFTLALQGGRILSSSSSWAEGLWFSFEKRRLEVSFSYRGKEESGYTERFTPFEAGVAWSLGIGKVKVGTERRLRFTEHAERKAFEKVFFESGKLDLSLGTGLRVGGRAEGERIVLGADDGGVYVRLSVVPDRLVVFSEEGKIGFEISVEFSDEGE